jgi:hypothetical protein
LERNESGMEREEIWREAVQEWSRYRRERERDGWGAREAEQVYRGGLTSSLWRCDDPAALGKAISLKCVCACARS